MIFFNFCLKVFCRLSPIIFVGYWHSPSSSNRKRVNIKTVEGCTHKKEKKVDIRWRKASKSSKTWIMSLHKSKIIWITVAEEFSIRSERIDVKLGLVSNKLSSKLLLRYISEWKYYTNYCIPYQVNIEGAAEIRNISTRPLDSHSNELKLNS